MTQLNELVASKSSWFFLVKSEVLSNYPKISVRIQMERPVSIRSDRNILNILFRWTGKGLVSSVVSHRRVAMEKRIQNGKDHSTWLFRFHQKMAFHFIIVDLSWSDCWDWTWKAPFIYQVLRFCNIWVDCMADSHFLTVRNFLDRAMLRQQYLSRLLPPPHPRRGEGWPSTVTLSLILES